MEVNGEEFEMRPGDAIRIKPGVRHRFTGLTNAEILEFSTQHFEDDSYRITKSEPCSWYKRKIVDTWRKVTGKDTNGEPIRK